jgi:hypothetical protein
MTTTSNLLVTHIETAQAQKEVTANQAFEAFDDAICEILAIDLTSGNATVTSAQITRALLLDVSGVATTGRTVTVPQGKRAFLVRASAGNSDPFSVVRGSTSIAMAPGRIALFYSDGTANGLEAVAGSSGVSQPYDIGSMYNGSPTASLVLLRAPLARAVTFPAGLTGSQGVAGVAATAQTDFDIQKNGSSVGTMRFAAAATVATFIMASQTAFAAGDVLTVVSPSSPDATLADLGFILAGTR